MARIYIIMQVLLLALILGCSSSPQGETRGEVRVDATHESGACRLTILGSSQKSYYDMRIEMETGTVLLDARVPEANSKPGVWKQFQADLAGYTVIVTRDSKVHRVSVMKDTLEIVITEKDVTQYSKVIAWL